MKHAEDDPRSAAFDVLRAVEERDAYAERALDAALERLHMPDPRDRGLVTELVYGVLRRRGTLDLCLAPHLRRPPARLDPEILRILRLGAYQILFLDRVPDHAAVNEAVTLAKRRGRPGASALVNGCLRPLCREKEGGAGGPARGGRGAAAPPAKGVGGGPGGRLADGARADFPGWLVSVWEEELGREMALELFRRSVQPPDTVLRANPGRATAEALAAALGAEGVAAEPVAGLPGAVRVRDGGDLRRCRAFRDGEFVQQDAASQAVGMLLDPRPGERVLDLCAAPGIKTSQAAERMENRGVIVAVDFQRARLKDLAALCARTGAAVARPLCADPAGAPHGPFRPGALFDRVLADVPCSGLGILRRNPERKWRPAPDFDGLARLQRDLLERAAGLVRAGGVLVYSTCTVNRGENEGVVERFLAGHGDFVLEGAGPFLPELFQACVSPPGFFCSWLGPEPAGSDLFFAARLRRGGA